MAIPVGYDVPPTMQELIQRYVRQEVSQAAEANDQGSFEDEDDFEVEPDDLLSGFQMTDLQMEEEWPQPDASPPPAEPASETGTAAHPIHHEGSMLVDPPASVEAPEPTGSEQ